MALVDVNFFSNALMRPVSYKGIIPTDKWFQPGQEQSAPFRTIVLLHGIMGNHADWVTGSRIAQLAAERGVAVIMPAGDNSFYVDQPASHNFYGEYVGRELVEAARKLFPLSAKREDTCIAGLSMGGYGALRNGLKYHETFGAIIGLSSAIITDHALASTEESGWHFGKRTYFESVFGDLSDLKGSDKDLDALVDRILAGNGDFPRIYMACGTEDILIENNRKFHDFLVAGKVPHDYVEGTGVHDWKFWDVYIEKALDWFLG